MLVGITYDLRQDYLDAGYGELETAEFDRPDTIDAIDRTLRELGFETDRIGNARALVARLAAGDRWDWSSISPRGCAALGARRRSQPCSISTKSPTPFPTPSCSASRCTKA